VLERPNPTSGLRHVALFAKEFEACERFYTEILGMTVEWRPDDDNVYLTSGNDNLALHRASKIATEWAKLDHIGFILDRLEDADTWFEFLKANHVPIKTAPRTHRDGARSFYCLDPDGTVVQMIYHPPLALGKESDSK